MRQVPAELPAHCVLAESPASGALIGSGVQLDKIPDTYGEVRVVQLLGIMPLVGAVE